MAIKLIVVDACSIPTEETGPQHVDAGTVVDVSKDDAATLTRIGRALYINKADDPTKGQFTASDAEVARWKKVAKPAKPEAPAA